MTSVRDNPSVDTTLDKSAQPGYSLARRTDRIGTQKRPMKVVFDYQEFEVPGLTKPVVCDRVSRLLPKAAATDPMTQSTRKYSMQLLACLVLAGLMADATTRAATTERSLAGDIFVRPVFAAESRVGVDNYQPLLVPAAEVAGKKVYKNVPVTAYSSTPDQTDSSPFETASGTQVRDGVFAANFLPIGTRVKIPEFYGDKVFIVEDRMNARYHVHGDIWMETREAAKTWGIRYVTLEVYPR